VAEDSMNDVRTEAVLLVASLRANSSIPYSVIPSIVDSFSHMAQSFVQCVQTLAEECITQTCTDSNTAVSAKQLLAEKLEICDKPLAMLYSVYKQDKYFEGHELYVSPESVCFGSRFESHDGVSKLVYDTFQYVSVQQTLQRLMRNKNYAEAMLRCKRVDGVMLDFADGERALQHVLFSNANKFSVMIQLFYDGVGTTNPLRGQSTMNNGGVFLYCQKLASIIQFLSCQCSFTGFVLFT
jgi:hypothetical protein